MFILVAGHPRSGTGYMAQLLSSMGLQVGHEVVREHGISHWQFAQKTDKVPYRIKRGRNCFKFTHVIHVIAIKK